MAKKSYVVNGKVIRVNTTLDLEPVDYQITVHLENLKAHYGEKRIKQFLKDFYFGSQLPIATNRKKKVQ